MCMVATLFFLFFDTSDDEEDDDQVEPLVMALEEFEDLVEE